MEINYPPYKITNKMLNYVSDIMKKLEKQILLIERLEELKKITR